MQRESIILYQYIIIKFTMNLATKEKEKLIAHTNSKLH